MRKPGTLVPSLAVAGRLAYTTGVSAWRAYGFFEVVIGCESDCPAAIEWLDEFLLPAFDRRESRDCDFRVEIGTAAGEYDELAATRPAGDVRRVPCFALDQRVDFHPSWTVSGLQVIADDKYAALYVFDGLRLRILAPPGSIAVRAAAMRVIREIAVARALCDPRLVVLHAAALEIGGAALLIAGPKGCGKTTALAHSSVSARARVLTNDRAVLAFSPTGIEVRAVPTFVTIRGGPFALLARLARRTPRGVSPAHLLAAELEALPLLDPAAVPDAYHLSPAQFASALGVELAPRAELAAVVFPEIDADAETLAIEALAPAAAERRLRAARFGLGSGKEGHTVFENLAGARRDPGADAQRLAELAAATPCFSLRLGSRAYQSADAGARIAALLAEVRRRR